MNIRRYYVPNSIIFVTQVVDNRAPIFQHDAHIELLRETLRKVKVYHPFLMLAYSFLPDHFHLMIRPTGKSNFSDIMHSLKPNFTKNYKESIGISGSMKFWQKGFWDHVIRNENDFQRHIDYVHYNSVKHGLTERPEDWAHSSYEYWLKKNYYQQRWGWSLPDSITNYDWQESEDPELHHKNRRNRSRSR